MTKPKCKHRPIQTEIYNFFVTYKQSTELIDAEPQDTLNHTSIRVEGNSVRRKFFKMRFTPTAGPTFYCQMCWRPAHLHPVCKYVERWEPHSKGALQVANNTFKYWFPSIHLKGEIIA